MIKAPGVQSFAPCAGLMNQVDAARLDCVSDDLALLLSQAGVRDVRAPFAAEWRFCLLKDVGELPRLSLPPDDQAAQLATRTGFTPRWQDIRDVTSAVLGWQEALDDGRAVAVTGDAYHLDWLPYHGNEHMPHGFVVEGLDRLDATREVIVHVVDPYDNVTAYGRAVPTTAKVPLGNLATALVGGSWAVLVKVGEPHPVDAAHQVHANATGIVAAERDGAFAALAAAHRDLGPQEVANLALQTWLLARNRGLHHAWLGDVRPALAAAGLDELPARFGEEVVTRWQRATEMAYLATRRVHAGRAAPPSVLTAIEDALAHEAAVAHWVLDRTGSARS